MKKVRFDPVEKSVAAEQRDPEFCCQITYKGASTVVVLLEILYWLYYVLILVFAIVKHRQACKKLTALLYLLYGLRHAPVALTKTEKRSIVILSVNLSLLALQIVAAGIGVWKEKPRLLQTHLVFLLLTMIWDLCMTTGFFILAVYPKAKEDQLIDYKGAEFNGVSI
ncbi:unnamed protein product [Haemonchus placei]|uniref:GpcrRhopsn4 domain-containing protein n=1 Tax=Haemonchus placei TaxID=6290 RepID=A0A0N4WLX9_HAEPC|nr:unnamed protein product [Haemonchus placei]